MIHFLADVLKELNKLNMEFQRHEMDVTSISAMLDLTIEKLKRRYLDVDENNFGLNSPYLSSFLKMAKDFELLYEDANGDSHVHALRSLPCDNAKYNDSLDECISMAKVYVTNILDSLNKHFEDISVYNAFKVFSPSSYPPDAYDREKMTLEWLNRVINRLNVDSRMVDIRKCINEREDFVGMLYQTAQHKSMHDSWRSCSVIKSWWDTYPKMMRLWQVSLVIPASTSSCERGFSRQNFIKNMCRSSLGLDTLDALMLLSIDAHGSLSIDWKIVFDMWMNAKRRRAMPLE
ncbi:hypothetical protein KP509_13G056600 [Ceratopteris richardii]|uniref:HAT C-terminal dimerisation domain-containing protein n=1 Tax=Ceratopteris richardii TaxID=49495 RepID=A0A8T2TJ13_CERRI|nr:hypothetical protein KP509_13G056600 [Ceratopteris richardii]